MERIRTWELLERLLPPAPAVVVDVGGGAGVHSIYLTRLGYEMHLIDPVPTHVDQALDAAQVERVRLGSARVGEARSLDFPDDSADAVMLMGPLYHLPERAERRTALGEAIRVTAPGGVVAAAAITRFASALDALDSGYLDDPEFLEIVANDLETGIHLNPTGRLEYFTTAYLHRPEDLAAELAEAGLRDVEIYAVEGIGWLCRDFGTRLDDPEKREVLLDLVQRTEREPSILGASPHLLAFGRVPR
jgi:ubiquinone/menaquinone biosynthesis C-methylase UbiE